MKVNFSNCFQSLANNFGTREALVCAESGRRYTYKEFHLLTNRIVNMLSDTLALEPGDRFINILENENLALLHLPTVLKGAVTGCMANYRDSLEEHRWQVECVEPKVAFIENALLDSHYPMLRERQVTVICMDPLSEDLEGVHYFGDLIAQASESNPNWEIDDREHIALIRFTGGTTGKGKPAMYSADNWFGVRDSLYALPAVDWSPETRALHLAPISHGGGQPFFATFCAGGCNVLQNQPDLARYCQLIEQERITLSGLVPTLMYRLLALPEAGQVDMSTLKTMLYGAAPISPGKLRQLQERFGNIFLQMYGSSENFYITLMLSKSAHLVESAEDEARLASAGQVNVGADVIIANESGEPVSQGEVGELWLRSRGTCLGYWNNPEKTAEEFTGGGYWKSGDMGYMDDQGFIYIVDRKKDMIITGGFNVYATEVEAVIDAHEAVLMSAVVGIPHEEWGETVHAEVVLRDGALLEQAQLIEYVKERLGGYKTPKSIKLVDQLPISAAGKVLRRVVREQYWQTGKRQIG